MRLGLHDESTLAALSPRDVAAWLRMRGFRHIGAYGDFGELFLRDTEAGELELILPTLPSARDFTRRMAELVEDLANAEDRSPEHVLSDLTLAPFDVKMRTSDADVASTLATHFCKWLSVTDAEINRLAAKICGDYVLVRKSAQNSHVIVKSKLIVKLDESRKTVKAFHLYEGRHGIERSSEGFVIPIARNLHIFLRIEESEGHFEYIFLQEPIQDYFENMLGFMEFTNMERKLLIARIFIARNNESWSKLNQIFFDDDPILGSLPEIKMLLSTPLDKDTRKTLPDVVLSDAFYES